MKKQNKKPTLTKNGLKVGRPKFELDWNKIDNMLMASMEGTEIAATIGIDVDTLYKRCVTDKNKRFSEYLREKKAKGVGIIKQVQFQVAVQERDKGMLIWLGKNLCGQKDKQEIQQDITNEANEVIIE